MGNVSSLARASTGLDSYVAELGNDLSYDKSLSSSRFLKTILARHVKGPLVLKIFIKPDPGMSLRVIQRRLKIERDSLADLPNIHTSQAFVETDKAGYLIRQWSRYNLYDRISTHPYLATLEKTWIAYQLLTGLRDARSRKIAHGDVKSENILITSDLTVLITDFSTAFKPTFLPLDDPSDFSFFFDTSGRRTCYLAPERFFSSNSHIAKARQDRDKDTDQWGKRDGKVTEAMDVFSAGCVLLEMWTEGRGAFSLSDLYSYREGAISLDSLLEGLEDNAVKTLIRSMLELDPEQRPSFDRILTIYRGTVFPEYFYTFFADYCLSLSETARDSDEPSADHTIRRLSEEWDSIKVNLAKEASDVPVKPGSVDESSPALLLLNLVCANTRNCVWPTSRLQSLDLLQRLAVFMTDEDVINRVLPFAVSALSDDVASVRSAACETLSTLILNITSITPQNALFIPEYILPACELLTVDSDVNVRCVYARSLVGLATKAIDILEMAVALKLHGHAEGDSLGEKVDYETLLADIVEPVEAHASAMFIDPSSQVKRVMLSTITDMCLFFGRRKSNDFILSHIMTYLNDRDWALRFAFFEAIVGVGAFLGHVSIEEYVLPLMMQALADTEEAVITRVIASLASLASLGLFPRGRLWELCQVLRPYLVHPNTWISHGAAGFLSAAAQSLPPTDVWCILYSRLRSLLTADIKAMDSRCLLDVLRPPLSRSAFNSAKTWAVQDSSHTFWSQASATGLFSGKIAIIKSSARSSAVSTTDESYLTGKGLPISEQPNLVVLKDLIMRQAQNYGRSNSDPTNELEEAIATPSVSLTSLGVTPITVFISPRVVGANHSVAARRLGRLDSAAEAGSRRSSFASRPRSDISPLEEVRKRLALLEPTNKALSADENRSDGEGLESVILQVEVAKSLSSLPEIAPLSAMSKRGVSDSVKAAPAVGAVHTVVQGTVDSCRRGSGAGATAGEAKGSSRLDGTAQVQASYTSTYEGRDPGIKALLDFIDLENYRQPLVNFGPRVSSSSWKKRTPRAGSARPTSGGDRGATLVAHLSHHTSGVTCFATSPDHLFFASGSSDTTVCIWDSARMERSVSAKPRLIYEGLGSPITAMFTIANSHCLAVAAANGSLHILRVHVTVGIGSAKYSRIEVLQSWKAASEDGAITSITSGSDATTLLVVLASGSIAMLDMRSWALKSKLRQPLAQGAITSICTDKSSHWILAGTALGYLSLWDLRFGLLVRTWRASGPVVAMRIHPNKGRGRWVAISVRSEIQANLIEVYDIETAQIAERYLTGTSTDKTESPSSISVDPRLISTATAVAELASGRKSDSSASSFIPAVLELATGETFANSASGDEGHVPLSPVLEGSAGSATPKGWMITAGDDRAVRFWDLGDVAQSFVICGSGKDKEATFDRKPDVKPTTFTAEPMRARSQLSSSSRSRLANGVHTESSARRDQATAPFKQLLRPHYDAVCALGTIETGYSSCLLTGDRSGVIKVWRIAGPRT